MHILGFNLLRSQQRTRWRRSFTATAAAGVLTALGLLPLQAGDNIDLPGIKAQAEQWLAVRRETAKAQAEWQKEQELLSHELELLREHKTSISQRQSEQQQQLHDLETALAELNNRSPVNQQRLNELQTTLGEAEAWLRSWATRLPPFLYANDADWFTQLAPATLANRNLAERLQTVVTSHSRLQQLSRTVHIGPMVLTTPAGDQQQMDTVFLGLATAYAVSVDNTQAAVGRPGADAAWQWSWQAELATPIRAAIACYNKEAPPSFIALPVSLPRGEP